MEETEAARRREARPAVTSTATDATSSTSARLDNNMMRQQHLNDDADVREEEQGSDSGFDGTDGQAEENGPGSDGLRRSSLRRKNRNRWTVEEEERLRRAVQEVGAGRWAQIKRRFHFHNRSNIDLKDKWRNLMRSRVEPAFLRHGTGDSQSNGDLETPDGAGFVPAKRPRFDAEQPSVSHLSPVVPLTPLRLANVSASAQARPNLMVECGQLWHCAPLDTPGDSHVQPAVGSHSHFGPEPVFYQFTRDLYGSLLPIDAVKRALSECAVPQLGLQNSFWSSIWLSLCKTQAIHEVGSSAGSGFSSFGASQGVHHRLTAAASAFQNEVKEMQEWSKLIAERYVALVEDTTDELPSTPAFIDFVNEAKEYNEALHALLRDLAHTVASMISCSSLVDIFGSVVDELFVRHRSFMPPDERASAVRLLCAIAGCDRTLGQLVVNIASDATFCATMKLRIFSQAGAKVALGGAWLAGNICNFASADWEPLFISALVRIFVCEPKLTLYRNVVSLLPGSALDWLGKELCHAQMADAASTVLAFAGMLPDEELFVATLDYAHYWMFAAITASASSHGVCHDSSDNGENLFAAFRSILRSRSDVQPSVSVVEHASRFCLLCRRALQRLLWLEIKPSNGHGHTRSPSSSEKSSDAWPSFVYAATSIDDEMITETSRWLSEQHRRHLPAGWYLKWKNAMQEEFERSRADRCIQEAMTSTHGTAEVEDCFDPYPRDWPLDTDVEAATSMPHQGLRFVCVPTGIGLLSPRPLALLPEEALAWDLLIATVSVAELVLWSKLPNRRDES